MDHDGLKLIVPRVAPVLDPRFRPAVLADRAFRDEARASGNPVSIQLALEQSDGSIFRFTTELLPPDHPRAAGNYIYLERLVKFLLWSRGGFRIHFAGPGILADRLQKHFHETPTGRFDSQLIGERVYGRPIEVISAAPSELPPESTRTRPLGRHLDGCRIGFDLGGSDRKAAALIDGRVVFFQEIAWDPYFQSDPQYHYDGIHGFAD